MAYIKSFDWKQNNGKGLKGAVVGTIALVAYSVAGKAIVLVRAKFPDMPIDGQVADWAATFAATTIGGGAAYVYERARNYIKMRAHI